MPVVRVSMLAGRTRAQKVALAKAITDAMVEIGKAKPEAVFIVFENVAKEDWATAGKLMDQS